MQANMTGNASAAAALPPLPYAQNALEPYVSARTMSFHYGKHHRAYVDNLNKLIAGASWADWPLEKIIRETAGVADKAAVFNNAAQVWNHTFFWHSMAPGAGGKPAGRWRIIPHAISPLLSTADNLRYSASLPSEGGWAVQDLNL